MFTTPRPLRMLAGALLAAAAALTLGGAHASAAPAPHSVARGQQTAAAGPRTGTAPVIDGVTFGYLPPGLGTSTDFTYDFDDIDFVSRTWESHRPEGGWRVDLDAVVMRGARLTDAEALRSWFIDYEQRDPQPTYVPVRVHGAPGFLCADQIFWLVRPGVAVSVQLDGTRWSTADVLRVARRADTSTA